MPTTRSQAAAEERTLRVYEDFPASPSEEPAPAPAPAPALARTDLRTAASVSAARTATDPTANAPASSSANERVPPLRPMTACAAPSGRSRAPSVRSQGSNASAVARIRQAELEAEERLAEIRRQDLQIQAQLINKRLAVDIATIREEETGQTSIGAGEAAEAEHRVSNWLQHHRSRGEPRESEQVDMEQGTRYRSVPREQFMEQCPLVTPNRVTFEQRPRSPTPTRSRDRGIDRLADALEKMARGRAPPRQTQDLPLFSGTSGDWLPFKAAMRESTSLYKLSAAENIARLRSCLRGEARQAVSALLFTATEPSVIMATLEQCYGRPEMIIDNALEDIKKLPRLGTTASELNSFAIKLQNIVTVITCLDERGYLQNPMLARQVTEKLSPHVRSKWCDYAEEHENQGEIEIVTLSRFLMREADRAMRHMYTAAPSRGTTHTYAATQSRGTTNARTSEQQPRANDRNRGAVYATAEASKKQTECFCCGAEHVTTECGKLAAMPVAKRWEWAKEARICFRCLNSKHRRFNCKSKRCGIDECRHPHHALLHAPEEKVAAELNKSEESVNTASAHVSADQNQVLLKVCPITIKGNNGKEVNTYALLDEGSTITLVDEEIAEMIGAQGPTRALSIIGVTSSQREPDSRVVNIEIRGHAQTNYQQVRARTVKNLTLGGQTVNTDLLQHAHLRELRPEVVCYAHAKPRILIGADNWHLIVTRKLLTGKRNQPAASLTRLGWIIHGSAPRCLIEQDEAVLHVRTYQETNFLKRPSNNQDDDLNELVKAHFDIDALGVSMNRKPKPEDERAKEIFNLTVKRVDGRFEVGLPWIKDDVTMPPSYNMALQRLRGIERKMDRSPKFKSAYTAEVTKLLQKGYAVRCEEDHDQNPRMWYLPHFAVTNPNKPNKVRMVFDAAACANGKCLNDALLDGPDLLQALYGVLFRFRKKPIAVTADIREMFLQLKIRPEDRVAQHFLWRGNDRSGPPQKYMMTSMIFGARSSPFLAHSVRDRNAADYKDSYPLAFNAITQNHYMDDWVDSFDDEEIAARTIAEVQKVHSQAGFELASWSSNRDHLLEEIPDQNRAHAPKELAANAHLYGKTLGILWIPATDELAFETAMHRVPDEVKNAARTPTKREALGAVMSLFDPLGVLCPYTITAKIMLQELWKKKVGWDEPLPPEEATMFSEWLADLKNIADLRLPRCYEPRSDVTRQQLHVFCDASEQAFAAVAFWRFERAGGVSVMLVAGKAKVAPLKAQSIPRMELQASLIGARLATEILKSHQLESEVILWSDSKTVLHWIRNDALRYTPYVAHRLSEIAELTRPEQWRWVPTAHNVADDATRAGNTKLRNDDRWFVGPAFLYEHEEHWPKEVESNHEQNETIVAHARERTPLVDVSRFSSYERLVRTIAYVLTFIDKCRKRTNELEMKHIREAERLLIRQVQRDSFPNDLERLAKGKNIDRTSQLYKLDPKYGDDEMIRLNGRINAANVPAHMKDPPILDGAHPITRLLIRREHEKNQHVGREQIVNSLRQRYWILRLRPTVKTVLHKCTWCKAKRANPAVPVKGDLPQVRLNTHTRPFAHCGIDCFGPMWVTIGRRKEKRWGMLFTCLVIRAIHVELIASLSTDSAIMAIRRMAARRGTPIFIASDNGTNFRGSDVELKRAYEEWLPACKNYALTERIEWRYIDPGAPNQGGAWERMIKTVKSALAATLTERAPREEVLATLMTEIEHTVNSRPLTHVPVDPEEQEALTPNHFLLGTAVGLPYVGECNVADKRTWRATQALANAFWARWIREYLPTLAPRGDVRRQSNNVKPGDVVIIADGLLPRNVWPRGQVERVYTGPDGVVRSAEVRTRGGTFRRPVRRLIVLPMDGGCEDLRRGENVADEVACKKTA